MTVLTKDDQERAPEMVTKADVEDPNNLTIRIVWEISSPSLENAGPILYHVGKWGPAAVSDEVGESVLGKAVLFTNDTDTETFRTCRNHTNFDIELLSNGSSNCDVSEPPFVNVIMQNSRTPVQMM